MLGVAIMLGSSLMKWVLVFLLFIMLPVLLLRYMVARTIEIVRREER
jgi:hypothetical protein